jgi:hypothetical protein
MKFLEKILDNKAATTLIVLLVVAIAGYYFFFSKPKEKPFQPTPPPPDGSAKEGAPAEIINKANILANAIYKDLSGLSVTKNVSLYTELANASDTYFVAVYNAFGKRDGEDLYNWLLNEFVVLNPIALLGGFGSERKKILDRIDFLKLKI